MADSAGGTAGGTEGANEAARERSRDSAAGSAPQKQAPAKGTRRDGSSDGNGSPELEVTSPDVSPVGSNPGSSTEAKAERVGESPTRDPLLGFSVEQAKELLREMLLYRRFEEAAEQAYAIGKIGGFCHLHIGQEAAAVGCIKPLRDDDYVITAYREHTQALAKGATPAEVMAELFGRSTGLSGGNGGSMHLFSAERGFMGGHGIVGGQTALGLGIAWAIKYRGEDQVCVCFMGDAAVNQGAFHESMNMAAVWDLPVLYVVENNDYGMGTKFDRVSDTPISDRALSYGIPTSQVDGQDALLTYRHFEALVAEVRAGGGPRFVDVLTYRFKGHSMSDPVSGTYRSKEEVEGKIAGADPIAVLRDRLMEAGHLDEADLKAIDTEVRAEISAAVEAADEAPLPGPDQLYRNVYAEINEHGRLFFDGRDRDRDRDRDHGDEPGGDR